MVHLAPQTQRQRQLPFPRRWRPPLRAVATVAESLTTPHGVDSYLALVNPMLTVRKTRAEVVGVQHPTPDSVRLTLRPTRQWQGFAAGQFVPISVVIDGVRHTRCYSPAGSQHRADGHFELTVKAHPEGIVSNHLKSTARRGLVLDLAPADGTFVLPAVRPPKTVFISGGSGVTPVLSMLRTLCDEGYRGEVVFLHYAGTERDVAYASELRDLAAAHDNVRLALAYTDADNGDLQGHFGQAHLDAVAPWVADAQTFLCGPPGLMRPVRQHYEAARLAERLHTEDFAPAPLAVADGEATGAVAFDRSGVSAGNSGATLLEQAEAAGLRPEFGCRMGICFSCTSVKKSGCTKNVLTGALDSDPDRPIQLCVNVPVGDVALDI